MSKKSDDRFSRFSTDPKFLSVARKDKKVNVDKRFGAMFKKKGKFIASESAVDPRGRPKILTKSTKDNYKKFYQIKDTDSSVSENTSDAGGENKTLKKNVGFDAKSKLLDLDVDYARGEGNLSSCSSSEEDSSSEDSSDDDSDEQIDGNDDQQWDKWGELDHEADSTKEATNRIAVCNMDWDRVDAQDIYIAMSSFCPTGSAGVKSVRIYKSEFGKTRMAEEERLGPEELRGAEEPDDDMSISDEEPLREDVKEMDNKAMDRVRKYQISRLKYYYAVVDFDSVGSASTVYDACDGVEYELSATRFDLRFIPGEIEFDEESSSSCESMPDPERYRPKMFSTTALTLGKVELTWDEANPERARAMRTAFAEAEMEEGGAAAAMAYIAMSSDDEIGDKEECEVENRTAENEPDVPEDAIKKYKALLAGIVKKENSIEEDEEGDIEISWGPRDGRQRDMDQKYAMKMTPWEQYLHSKKEKRKSKREERKMKNQPMNADKSFSDDESPEAINLKHTMDSVCKDESEEMGRKVKRKGKRQEQKNKRDEDRKDETAGGNAEAKDLSLLIMDEEEDRKHFDYKDIVSKSKNDKNQRRKIMDEEQKTSDHFKMDLDDQRFSAVFHNPEFNVDPSNPHFKKTKSMQDIVQEKQRLAAKGFPQERKGEQKKRLKLEIDKESSTLSKSSKSLELLVKAVKNKTADSKIST